MKLPNSSKYYILFHYSEIGLKGGNRKRFEEQLLKNIRQVLRGVVDTPTIRSYGRFLTPLPENFDWPLIQFRLKKVVGLAYFSLAEIVEQDTEKITETASRHMCSLGFSSFRVTTRRAQKKFLLNSTELSTVVGSAIQTQSGARVDLDNPEAVCYIEIFNDHAFVYTERIAGCRGLPVGSSGKAVSLLSSGIDSPVASWKIICRGVKLVFLHFHSIPFTTQASVRNTRRLVERLTEYQLAAKLYTVPFLEIQQSIMINTRADYRVVLYRRAMLRIAEMIARRERAQALITGESIGQVASQTLRNMRVIGEGISLPILRPLSGTEKEEIVSLARQIGTFKISTEPYEDCCSLFVPDHPVTSARAEIIYNVEEQLDLHSLEKKALRESEISRFEFPTKTEAVPAI